MDVPECKNGAARRNFCIFKQRTTIFEQDTLRSAKMEPPGGIFAFSNNEQRFLNRIRSGVQKRSRQAFILE
ncbi:MAG: hypothetical protein DRI57_07530 [Deltaproteobacteria bacterium]|nr:MAG: hypothetical protein DRI57_07530 [Deltaproteobacteria bacterium]